MSQVTTPTRAEVYMALQQFARAASHLTVLWSRLQSARDDSGQAYDLEMALTQTYPATAMPMSFDEIAAELGEWPEAFHRHLEH